MSQAGAVADQRARISSDRFLGFLPVLLKEPRRAWLVIPIAWALSFLGSVALALLVPKTIRAMLTGGPVVDDDKDTH